MGKNSNNRDGGCGRETRVKPPSISLSREFAPKDDPGTPMSIDDMSRRAVDSGYIDGDSPAARFIYGRISYQHISEYFPLLDESTTDLPHTIQSIHHLMSFDRSFQALLLKYTGLIELQLRSRYSKEMSTRFGAFAHRNPKLYVDSSYFDDYLKRYSDVVKNALKRKGSKQARDIERYGDMPIWEAVEEMPFGMVSKLYSMTKNRGVRDAVADSFSCEYQLLKNWLRTLTVVRNRCAHFGKLLGEKIPIMPKQMKEIDADNGNPFYAALMIMRLLRTNSYYGDLDLLYSTSLAVELAQLFEDNALLLNTAKIPENWKELLLSEKLTGVRLVLGDAPEDELEFPNSPLSIKLD